MTCLAVTTLCFHMKCSMCLWTSRGVGYSTCRTDTNMEQKSNKHEISKSNLFKHRRCIVNLWMELWPNGEAKICMRHQCNFYWQEKNLITKWHASHMTAFKQFLSIRCYVSVPLFVLPGHVSIYIIVIWERTALLKIKACVDNQVKGKQKIHIIAAYGSRLVW